METVTYSLNIRKERTFYQELSDFTTLFLTSRSDLTLRHVSDFMQSSHNTSSRTFDEYYLEYLTLGVLFGKYSSNALSSWKISLMILNKLYKYRSRYKSIKPALDKVRGILSTLFLNNRLVSHKVDSSAKLRHFILWMDATGEFSEESARLKSWQDYLKSLPHIKQVEIFYNTNEEALNFEIVAKASLGAYTENVKLFREKHLDEHKFKENFIFCGRFEVEYHLNMFGAEILNRALKPGFNKTSKKVILLPTCMSNPIDGKCKARLKGSKLVCTGCSPECSINVKRWEYSSRDTEVVLIPHSSEFTRFLKYWKNQETVGLIGVACVLNLLKGGYEMQKLNIPSQCVFLDYCGCKKHWHKNGIPTDINGEQLQKVVG